MTHHELLRLARILSEAQGLSLATISRRATGRRNTDLFDRLASGGACTSRTIDQASAWFIEHWPPHVIWPADIARPEPPRCAAQ